MSIPFSPRGARRGLLLAGVGAALWLVWAAGYLQGSRTPEIPEAPGLTAPAIPGPETPRKTEA